MTAVTAKPSIQIFSTCPQSKDHAAAAYPSRLTEVARWSEEIGCTGALIYTDNGLIDPWLAAQEMIRATTSLCPLVAVQPLYMHPYTAAKMVSTLALLHGRRVWLNMLAGGFKNDLTALGDDTPHDDRYVRTVEYTTIIRRLLAGGTVDFAGKYYQVRGLRLTPALPPALFPGLFISGSSEAGLAAAREIDAIAVKYPRTPENEQVSGVNSGVRLGIIARDGRDKAWSIAHRRFPADRHGELAHGLAMKTSDSVWHKQLSEDAAARPPAPDDPYWLHPFKTYKTFCPYLVGSYDDVAAELADYMRRGFASFILDIPPSREELLHVRHTFDRASALIGA